MYSTSRSCLPAAVGASCFMMSMLAAPALAHDSWLVPDQYSPAIGQEVRIAFVTGEVFPISDSATRPERVAEWLSVDHRSRGPVSTFRIDNQELVAVVGGRDTGDIVHAVRLHPRFMELEPDAFVRYLRDERAEHALRFREDRSESTKPGRELYTKLAKTFTRVPARIVPPAGQSAWDKPVGHPLEIVPVNDPLNLRQGDSLRVRVLRNGQPDSDRWVSAAHEGLPPHHYVVSLRTNADGLAEVPLMKSGRWFVRTHVIERLPADHAPGPDANPAPAEGSAAADQPPAEWQSYWASITFPVAER